MRVAICGPMGSGKSHLAQRLIDEHGFVRISLARGVKLMGERIIESLIESGVVDEDQRHVKQRRMLQAIGAVGREIDPMIWINDTLNMASMHERVVIDDVRFINEANALVDYGFTLVRLSFSDEDLQRDRLMRAYPEDWQRHLGSKDDVSETEMARIPQELVGLEMSVMDGDGNWSEMAEHLGIR